MPRPTLAISSISGLTSARGPAGPMMTPPRISRMSWGIRWPGRSTARIGAAADTAATTNSVSRPERRSIRRVLSAQSEAVGGAGESSEPDRGVRPRSIASRAAWTRATSGAAFAGHVAPAGPGVRRPDAG